MAKGTVRALRPNASGQEDVRPNVDIHGSNSGGALLDKQGNIVGLNHVGTGGPDDFSTGLHLFIPNQDASQKLNILLTGPRRGPAS